MKRVLLTAAAFAAALTLSGTPAAAEQRVATGIPDAKTFGQPPTFMHGFTRDHFGPRDHRLRRRSENQTADVIWGGYDLQSSYDDRDWRSDGGNDWWHDRPDRAFPRWVQHNQDCTRDRMWWSGAGWHC